MDSLEQIIFTPLKDEESNIVTGWLKETVNYAINNRSKVEKQIRSVARGLRKYNLQNSDMEDIYSDILLYLYNCDDYNINKAIQWSSTGAIVTLEGYLNVCIRFCVMRYCSQLNNYDREVVSESVCNDDDKEISLFDSVPDDKSEIALDYLMYDLETLCKSCEPVRYRFGPDTDIYLILYVRLLTSSEKHEDVYRTVLGILNISKKDISQIERYSEDSVMVAFAKAISITPIEKAISIIEKYVYSAVLVKKTVMSQFV